MTNTNTYWDSRDQKVVLDYNGLEVMGDIFNGSESQYRTYTGVTTIPITTGPISFPVTVLSEPINISAAYRVSFTIIGRCVEAANPAFIGQVISQKKINVIRDAHPPVSDTISTTNYNPALTGLGGSSIQADDELPLPPIPMMRFDISGSFFYRMKYSWTVKILEVNLNK